MTSAKEREIKRVYVPLELDSDDEDAGMIWLTSPKRSRSVTLEQRRKVGGPLQRLVHDPVFQMAMVGVILANAFWMAVQIDYSVGLHVTVLGWHVHVFLLVNVCFLSVFTIEISLRLLADGCSGFFFDPDDWCWNAFDFTIVFIGLTDQIIFHLLPRIMYGAPDHHHKHRHGNCHAMMAARTLRILRVLRVVRVFRAFKKLRMLAQGLIESVGIVFWIFVSTLLMIFLCAILTTTIIGQNLEAFPPDERDHISELWGSVSRSMFTLFQFLTLDGWGAEYMMVTNRMPWMILFFFPFIFFGAFVIMSLLTGVMADHMNDVRQETEEEELRDQMTQLKNAEQAVHDHDSDGDGKLNPKEFGEMFSPSKAMSSTLKDLGITVTQRDALELFEWFDVGRDRLVDHRELRHGCESLIRGLTPLQRFRFGSTVRAAAQFVNEELSRSDGGRPPWAKLDRPPSRHAVKRLEELDATVSRAERRIHEFELRVRSMMEGCGCNAQASMLDQELEDAISGSSE